MTVTRILIVEDQEEVSTILKFNLEPMSDNYQISIAADGFEALDMLREKPFDLVITDYMMPDMDGLELIETIRKLSPNTQIILISALKHNSLYEMVAEANIEHFLQKPFSGQEIRNVVQQVLDTVKAARQQQTIVPPSEPEIIANSDIEKHLQTLLNQTGAYCCFVVTERGYLLARAGGTELLPLPMIASLAAANALAAAEVSKLLHNPTPFEATIQEGEYQNVATYALEEGALLVIIFNKRVKIGLIQHYARRNVAAIIETLQTKATTLEEKALGDDFAVAMDASLDEIFSIDNSSS